MRRPVSQDFERKWYYFQLVSVIFLTKYFVQLQIPLSLLWLPPSVLVVKMEQLPLVALALWLLQSMVLQRPKPLLQA